jgi:hypothetical protein
LRVLNDGDADEIDFSLVGSAQRLDIWHGVCEHKHKRLGRAPIRDTGKTIGRS